MQRTVNASKEHYVSYLGSSPSVPAKINFFIHGFNYVLLSKYSEVEELVDSAVC